MPAPGLPPATTSVSAHYRWQGCDLLLRCHVQANARGDEISGLQAGRLKVRVAAPALEGRANQRLRRFLAASFGVSPSAVSIEQGEGHRFKSVLIAAPQVLPAGCGIAGKS